MEEEDNRPNHRRRMPKKASSESQHTANLRRARRSIEDGQYKKAMQAHISDGLAHVSDVVYAEMLAKHPQSSLHIHLFQLALVHFQDILQQRGLLVPSSPFLAYVSGTEGSHSIHGCLDGVLLWCSSLPPFG